VRRSSPWGARVLSRTVADRPVPGLRRAVRGLGGIGRPGDLSIGSGTSPASRQVAHQPDCAGHVPLCGPILDRSAPWPDVRSLVARRAERDSESSSRTSRMGAGAGLSTVTSVLWALIPLVTFGWGAGFAFAYAAIKLRDRMFGLIAVGYVSLGLISFMLVGARTNDGDWRGNLAPRWPMPSWRAARPTPLPSGGASSPPPMWSTSRRGRRWRHTARRRPTSTPIS